MKVKTIQILTLGILLTLLACQETVEKSFVEKSEDAHNKIEFYEKEAIEFDINLIMGGKTRLDGKMTLLTNSTMGLIEENDGSKLYFINDRIYLDTAITALEGSRFKAYTWSYFFLFPYKLSDPGTIWNKYEDSTMNGVNYFAEKLTFESGTGDADQDWYIVYADSESHLINTAAYVVTANKSLEEAEKDPHAIAYHDYKSIDNIQIAHRWTFHEWRKDGGLTKELGEGILSNVKFISVDSTFFTPPSNFIEN